MLTRADASLTARNIELQRTLDNLEIANSLRCAHGEEENISTDAFVSLDRNRAPCKRGRRRAANLIVSSRHNKRFAAGDYVAVYASIISRKHPL